MTLLDSNAVAELLGVTTDALRKWRQLRKGPDFHRVGGTANESQKKIQLFGMRNVVHHKVMAFLAGIEETGKPPEYANLQQFLRDTKDSDLLFGQEVASFVNEVYSKALAYKTHHQVWEPIGDGPERTAKYGDVRKAADAARECWVRACTPNSNVFRKYLELT